MAIVLGVALVVLLIAVLLAQFLAFPAMWIGFRDQWRRLPSDRRRRGLLGGGLALVLVVTASTLSITQPWGRHSVVYVILIGGGAVAVLAFGGVAVQATRDARRARDRSNT